MTAMQSDATPTMGGTVARATPVSSGERWKSSARLTRAESRLRSARLTVSVAAAWSLVVSDESRLSRSPVRASSNHATSCARIRSKRRPRSRATTRWPDALKTYLPGRRES